MLESFTLDYYDYSTEAGFEFVFYCDFCHCSYRSTYIKAGAYKGKGGLKALFEMFSDLIGKRKSNYNCSYSKEEAEKAARRFKDFSPEWHIEHELAFLQAQDEAKTHFNRCSKCFSWVCDKDFDVDERVCNKCIQ